MVRGVRGSGVREVRGSGRGVKSGRVRMLRG